MNSPIYKDFFYTTTAATLDYAIVTDGVTIFRGKAWRNPDTNTIKINVADIVRDWLSFSVLPDFRPLDDVVTKQAEAYKVFTLYNASSGSQLAEYKVLFDWTGEWNGEKKVLSNPINGVLDPRMKIVWTIYGPTAFDVTMEDIPLVRNTYFEFLENPIVISWQGGTYNIPWRTNYYPPESIDPSTIITGVTFSGQTFNGVTGTFPASETPEPRSFPLYAEYGGQQLGEVTVIQRVRFDLYTKYLNVPKEGGTYTIYYDTEIDPQDLSYAVSGMTGVILSGFTSTGCTAYFPPNGMYVETGFSIGFYFDTGGTSYYLDQTDVNVKARYIDSAVTRDITILPDGTFVGFEVPGILVINCWDVSKAGYYPERDTQFEMDLYCEEGVNMHAPARNGLANNIPLCLKEEKRNYEDVSVIPYWDIEGYSLSADTTWLHDLLAISAGGRWPQDPEVYLDYESGLTSNLYMYSGDTLLDSVTVVSPLGGTWNKCDGQNMCNRATSAITPYQYADFKFKSTGYTENDLRAKLQKVIPPWNKTHAFDAVYSIDELGTNQAGWPMQYSVSAFTFEVNGDWTTVKTPLPIQQIVTLSALPATEIWISDNVKRLNVGTNRVTAISFGGTKQDFRRTIVTNVFSSDVKQNGVQCTDGKSFGFSSDYSNWQIGKSDPVVFKGNTFLPAHCNGYLYDGEELIPQKTVEITFSTTPWSSGYGGYFYGLDGKELIPTNVSVNGSTATLTFAEDVYTLKGINEEWTTLSDVFRYVYPPDTYSKGTGVPLKKMRIMGDYYGTPSGEYLTLEFDVLKAIIGEYNLNGTASNVKFIAPNLVYMGLNALRGSSIKEMYIPNIQYIYNMAIPATCTAMTIGKHICYMSYNSFALATGLTAVTFEGTIDEWNEMNAITLENTPAGVFRGYSNVRTIHCIDGDVSL